MKRLKISIKKLLIIYSAIIVAVGIFSSSALFYKDRDVSAAGWVVNGEVGNCLGSSCICTLQGGCEVWRHVCREERQSGICISSNPERLPDMAFGDNRSYSSFYSGLECAYIQIDVNYHGSDPSAADHGGVTFFWDDWSVCGEEPPPPPPPPGDDDEPPGPPPDDGGEGCPYDSTEARVRKNPGDTWLQSMELVCGESFYVGSFHNNNFTKFANDTVMRVTPPVGVDKYLGNNQIYQTSALGKYDVYVGTLIPGTDNKWYKEAECLGYANVICVEEAGAGGFRITKVATNEKGPYDLGAIVNFRVVIENTGDQTLNAIAYRDVFDSSYLEFVYVLAVSPSYPGGFDMTPHLSVSKNGNITTLSNPDITSQLGDLGPGQLIYFDYTFRAKSASSRACNDAFAKPEGLSEKQARDCVGILISTDI